MTPHNIECYKFHKYGNIARDYRRKINTSMKSNIDLIYTKVCKRKKEEQVNKYQVLEITRLVIVQDEDKSTRKKEVVRYKKVWRRNTKPKEQVNKE
jgi:hypothetical protein